MLRINYSDTVHLIASQNTSCDLITKTRGNTANIFTVKPLNTGHLRVLKYLSVIKRCPLLGGNFKKIVTFETESFVCYSWHAPFLRCLLLIGFTVFVNLKFLKVFFITLWIWKYVDCNNNIFISDIYFQ